MKALTLEDLHVIAGKLDAIAETLGYVCVSEPLIARWAGGPWYTPGDQCEVLSDAAKAIRVALDGASASLANAQIAVSDALIKAAQSAGGAL